MKKILILYYSRHGSVAQLANQVGRGVESVENCEALLRSVAPVSTVCEATESEIPDSGDVFVTIDDLAECDGLILGSPTRFGTIAAPLKYFFDQTAPQWLSGTLKDKPAAVFTSSSSMHGGQESTLLGMMLPLIHHGMVMIGIPFSDTPLAHTGSGGTPYGASHVAGSSNNAPLTREEIELGYILGRRVANAAVALNGNSL
jgi:NAD(P)H dehydrogenase (quinone)